MTVELSAPPKIVDRCRYKKIIDQVVAADGEWLRVSLDQAAPGCTVAVKQSRLWQAARVRGLRVQTTFQEGAIYLRLRKDEV